MSCFVNLCLTYKTACELILFSAYCAAPMKSRKVAKSVRRYRTLHKYIGITLAVIVLVSAITGILLAWKKQSALLQPPTQKGITTELSELASVKEMVDQVVLAVDSLGLTVENLDRLEYRATKGIAKAIFDTGNWEVQIDASNLEILSVAKRHSDWIEQLHDGSIISEVFKLISMNVLGIGLLILILSGYWLWYGPKKIRRLKD